MQHKSNDTPLYTPPAKNFKKNVKKVSEAEQTLSFPLYQASLPQLKECKLIEYNNVLYPKLSESFMQPTKQLAMESKK